jgi:hypothetical protein
MRGGHAGCEGHRAGNGCRGGQGEGSLPGFEHRPGSGQVRFHFASPFMLPLSRVADGGDKIHRGAKEDETQCCERDCLWFALLTVRGIVLVLSVFGRAGFAGCWCGGRIGNSAQACGWPVVVYRVARKMDMDPAWKSWVT